MRGGSCPHDHLEPAIDHALADIGAAGKNIFDFRVVNSS
jgi:hypothetical protein